MTNEPNNLTIAEFLNINPNDYRNIRHPFRDMVDPHWLVQQKLADIPKFPDNISIEKVLEGEYQSGQLWEDSGFHQAYLYLGKTNEGKDAVINLMSYHGFKGYEVSHINGPQQPTIIFDKRIPLIPKETSPYLDAPLYISDITGGF